MVPTERLAALQETRFLGLIPEDLPIDRIGRLPGAVIALVGTSAHALLYTADEASFGAVLLWCRQAEVASVDLFVDGIDELECVTRWAHSFPVCRSVRSPAGAIHDGSAEEMATQVPLPMPELQSLQGELAGRGLDVFVDQGTLVVERLGLEVAIATLRDGETALEVGVGAVDREANRVLHPTLTPWDLLERVVAEVDRYRHDGEASHPFNRIARERWLDYHLRQTPSLVAEQALLALPPASPRRGMRTEGPAASIAQNGEHTTIVVSTVGADVSLLGAIGELVARHRADRLRVVVPTGSAFPLLHDLDDFVRAPATLSEVDPPWASGPP